MTRGGERRFDPGIGDALLLEPHPVAVLAGAPFPVEAGLGVGEVAELRRGPAVLLRALRLNLRKKRPVIAIRP